MRIAHVVASVEAKRGGPSYTVPRLCKSLTLAGVDVELHVSDGPALVDFEPQPYPVTTYPYFRAISPLRWSPRLYRAIKARRGKFDLLHNHGLWLMPNVQAIRLARELKVPLVVSPRGMMSPWALKQSRWRKGLMWWISHRHALRVAKCFHATADLEADELRLAGVKLPIANIPNGVDFPNPLPPRVRDASSRTLLYLGRYTPKKGIDWLLRSWREIQDEFPHWKLRVLGPDERGYQDTCQRMAAELGVQRVSLESAVYGEEKYQVYRSADLFILPTHSENFGVTVCEALACEVPVITTQGTPWKNLDKLGCGWCIPLEEAALPRVLRSAMNRTAEDLASMGKIGRDWVETEFGWDHIGQRMAATYAWILGGGSPPPWVRTD